MTAPPKFHYPACTPANPMRLERNIKHRFQVHTRGRPEIGRRAEREDHSFAIKMSLVNYRSVFGNLDFLDHRKERVRNCCRFLDPQPGHERNANEQEAQKHRDDNCRNHGCWGAFCGRSSRFQWRARRISHRLYLRTKLRRRGKTELWSPLQGTQDDLVETHINLHLPRGRLQFVRGQLARKHFVEHDTERIDVSPVIGSLMNLLLWCHVLWGAC